MTSASAPVAVCLALTLAACSGGSTPSTNAVPSPSASSSPTAVAPSASPTPSAPAVSATVLVGPLILDVPAGWRAVSSGASIPDFSEACIEPATPRPAMFGCAGLDVFWNWTRTGYLPGNESTSFTVGPGWYSATDVQPCPVDPNKGPSGLNGVRPDAGMTQSLRPVGDRKADYYQWTAHCDSGYKFRPRAWYLPVSQVVMFDRIEYDDVDQIASTAQFDTGSWKVGYLTAVSTAGGHVTVEFDDVTWLDGPAAVAYSKAHGGNGDVPDDYIIDDPDSSSVPIPVTADAKVISAFELAHTEPGKLRQVPVARLVSFLKGTGTHGATIFHVHINATGRADYLEEQFRP